MINLGAWLAAAVLAVPFCTGEEEGNKPLPITMDSLYRSLWDLESLALPEEGVAYGQCGSTDPARADGNRDFGNYRARTADGQATLCALEGPGVIVRIWSANPCGEIAFLRDGEEAPVFSGDMERLFDGSTAPFLPPLVHRLSSGLSYVPLAFKKSMKVVLKEKVPLFYQIGYKTFPPGTEVDASGATKETIDQTLDVLSRPGPELLPLLYPGDLETAKIHVEVEPGLTEDLFLREGAGRIALLELKGISKERHFLRKAVLKIQWDESARPAVHCPLGDFFGAPLVGAVYRALPMGVTGNGGYCLFPMPFDKGARITVENQGAEKMTIEGRVVVGPLTREGPHLWFHAAWKRENPASIPEYTLLKAWGRGKFVGCALLADNPSFTWWGEGDERIRIDGKEGLFFQGTGTIDYFGDAWGAREHALPYSGCYLKQGPGFGNKTGLYRFHIADAIPFDLSLTVSLENSARDMDYASTVWWYQDSPEGNTFFHDPPLARRIPQKPRAPDALEGEDLPVACSQGTAMIMDDSGLEHELSRGKAVILRGKGPFALTLKAPAEGDYLLLLGPAQGLPVPRIEVTAPPGMFLAARTVPHRSPGFMERFEAAEVHLREGPNTVYLTLSDVDGENGGGRLILDFVEIRKAMQGP